MHLAVADLVRAKWSDDIHEEWIQSLLETRPDLRREQLERTRELMNAHVRDCIVTGYDELIAKLTLPDPDDRHVLAAAIHAKADAIVTFNLRDFPASALAEHDIVAVHPDDFVNSLLTGDTESVVEATDRHRESLKNPKKTIDEYLDSLERQGLVETCKILRELSSL